MINKICLLVSIFASTSIFSCCNDDDKDEILKANLPKLSIDTISMSGVLGIHDAVTFSIYDVPL